MNIRMLSLLLALLLAVTFCGCNGGEGGGGGAEEKIEPLPGETPVDLQGYIFTVADYMDGRWNKEKSGTPYADAWIQILDEVETLYNCEIVPTYLRAGEMFTAVQPEVAAGGKYADLIITTEWEYGTFLGAGLMKDLYTLDVNWDNEWWNQNLRANTSYGGKHYIGGGSFVFDTMWTWLLYYNEAIWDQHGFPDPYELVDSGRWTQDRFAEYCRIASSDEDNSGALDSAEDVWGIIAADSDFCDAWYQGMGGRFFKTNEETGRVEMAGNDQRSFAIFEKMYNMVKKDKTFCTLDLPLETDKLALFTTGRSLFYAYRPGVGGLTDMEDSWGVIPMPKFDEEQADYLSGVDHNASVFGVTNTNTDTREVSILLEALGRHAMILEDIYWPDYKETYWRHEEEDTRMVSEYVVGHGQNDMALIMARCNSAFGAARGRLFGCVFRTNGADYSSYVDAVEDVVETTIQEYFAY